MRVFPRTVRGPPLPLLPRLFLLASDFKTFTTQYTLLFSRSQWQRLEDQPRDLMVGQ
ncbi:hypothetical protein KSF_085830 [Reticulibacter mediterranei]|uniref:Uncharacterized protein n=1 Tax=Reticulibacter mediterranei TaxID=2778369 RepID=A0A8J3IXB6_9CHLR|nr:hypothetical protein [Reticulibacter mediterranei]GHO98535.1 hypothetical protein KSF_085830 [Reticulibacter mediterranei]